MAELTYREIASRLAAMQSAGMADRKTISQFCKQQRIPVNIAKRILASINAPQHQEWTLLDVESMASLERARAAIGGMPKHIPKYYQKLPQNNEGRLSASRWQKVKRQILKRDNYTCQYCGSKKKPLHCDHIMPISRGGSNDPSNLIAACQRCNLSKHDKTLQEWRPSLVHKFSGNFTKSQET
jgi:hypothetical protein